VNSPLASTMQLHWTVSLRASCLHAAEALAHGQLIVDPILAEAITPAAQELRKAITAAGLPRIQFWRNLVGLSVLVDGLGELAERAVAETVGATRAAPLARNLLASLAGLESSVRRVFPDLRDELALLIVHGCLHLAGYDHAEPDEQREMWALQADILRRVGVEPPPDL